MIIEGFRYAAVAAGIRKKERLDLALIACDRPATAAGVFTTSLVKAAPVLLDMERIRSGRAQAILVNSGIANACSGEPGMRTARQTSLLLARELGIDENLVQVSSTGVIGEQLDVSRFEAAIPGLVAKLRPEGFEEVSRAIMTTDTVPKTASCTVVLDGQEIKIFGMAKGAGMIMPNMATMLSFVVTDAAIEAAALQQLLAAGVEGSFNAITVDGDTSTNDTVLVLANGAAANRKITTSDQAGLAAFGAGLGSVLRDLALQIVRDGEGANKLVTIRVAGARDYAAAKQAAMTVANSPLVKTAFFGEDANWGRIIAALGRSGVAFDPNRVDIGFDDALMVRDGLGQGKQAEAAATEVLKKKAFTVFIDLKGGPAAAEVYTCDFSIDYVKINADYRS